MDDKNNNNILNNINNQENQKDITSRINKEKESIKLFQKIKENLPNQNDKAQIEEEINPLFNIDNSSFFKKKKKKTTTINIFLPLLFITTLIVVSLLVSKTFTYGKKIEKYEEVFTEIEKKNEESIIISEGNKIDSEVLKKVAATELINCINQKIETDK